MVGWWLLIGVGWLLVGNYMMMRGPSPSSAAIQSSKYSPVVRVRVRVSGREGVQSSKDSPVVTENREKGEER